MTSNTILDAFICFINALRLGSLLNQTFSHQNFKYPLNDLNLPPLLETCLLIVGDFIPMDDAAKVYAFENKLVSPFTITGSQFVCSGDLNFFDD